jgi:2-aminoadipate transaminase
MLCQEYRKRRDCLVDALNRYFPPESIFHIPASGVFVWVELPNVIDTKKLLTMSLSQAGVAFIPSEAFSANSNIRITNSMRLNFSHSSPDKIERGIKRLSIIVKEMLRTHKQSPPNKIADLLS